MVSPEARRLGVTFVGRAATPRLSCGVCVLTGCNDAEGFIVGVGGPDGKGVVSPVLVPVPVVSAET